MGRWLLLGVDCGPRTQDTAAARSAPVVARPRAVPRWLTDGGQASPAARLPGLGGVYRRRRRGQVGRTPPPRLVAPQTLVDAPGVQGRHPAGQVVEISRRVVVGGPCRLGTPWRLRPRGTPIQTACMARGDGPWRGRVAPLRRRPRCLSWRRPRPRGKVWRGVSLDTLVMP